MHRLKRPPHANPLAGLPLDRLSHRRADTAWLTERLADPTSRLAFVWREQGAVLPIGERAMRTLLLRPDQAAPLLDRARTGIVSGLVARSRPLCRRSVARR